MRLTMPTAGRTSLAKAIADNVSIYAAIGRGDVLWTASPPVIDIADTALEDPFAVIRPTAIQYVESNDPTGAIETSDGSKWDIVAGPTRFLYMTFNLGYADAAGETIREFGLYFDSVLTTGGGQTYNDLATEVTSLGSLLGLKRFAPIVRTASLHEFGEIITF